jgi:hypothetical protein
MVAARLPVAMGQTAVRLATSVGAAALNPRLAAADDVVDCPAHHPAGGSNRSVHLTESAGTSMNPH